MKSPRTEKKAEAIPEVTENYGSWMIAPKRGRRVGRGDPPNYNRHHPGNKDNNTIQGGSRFMALEVEDEGNGVEGDFVETSEQEHQHRGMQPVTQRGKRPNVTVLEKQIARREGGDLDITSPRDKRPNIATGQALERGRKKPKQAATESKHIVVLSSNKGKTIEIVTIRNDPTTTVLHGIPELELYEHHNDPPTRAILGDNDKMEEDISAMHADDEEELNRGEDNETQ